MRRSSYLPKTGFGYQTDQSFYIDERGMVFFLAFALPKRLGAATFYVAGASDSKGKILQGEFKVSAPIGSMCRRMCPPNSTGPPPTTSTPPLSFATCRGRVWTPMTKDKDMRKNPDGSVDVYFVPKAPEGHEANWVPAKPGRPWFSFFRFYGPVGKTKLQALADRGYFNRTELKTCEVSVASRPSGEIARA